MFSTELWVNLVFFKDNFDSQNCKKKLLTLLCSESGLYIYLLAKKAKLYFWGVF